METVSHHDRQTAYRIVGTTEDGPGVCYVHGSGGSHRIWARQYGQDAPSEPAVAIDLSGHGESDDVDTNPGPGTLAAYADDVVAVARATTTRILVGNSLGGAVVQRVLLDRDLAVEGAVLLGTGAKLAVIEDLRAWLAEDFDRAVEFLHGTDRLFHDPDTETLDRSRREMRATGRAITERDFTTSHTFDVRDRLHEIAEPVLALVGEHDQLTPPRYHHYLAEHVQHGRVETVPGAAHLAMVEQSAAVNEAIRTFVASLESN